ncbi:MAG: T9SS type A sorting domain-containing protein, partial [bacterium]|nr:T9SS type A sorting domain-containing protein [Candidatus Limimorpha equi]
SNDNAVIDANAEISGDAAVGDLTINNGKSLVVDAGRLLTVGGTFVNNAQASEFVLNEGAQLVHNTPNVQATVQKNITGYGSGNGNWYLVASPFVGNMAATPLITGEYDLYSYDESTHYWMNSKDLNSGFNTLANGTGYLYANEADKQVVLSGELQPSNNHVDVPLSYTPSLNTLRGFNLVGNPFPCKAMLMGGNIAADFYVMNDDRDELEVSQNNIINPYEGIFVEATSPESVAQFYRWNPDYRGGESSASFDITVNEGRNEIDRARVRMGEGVGLCKFSLNDNSAKIYIPMDKQDYASVYVSGQNVLPLNFKPAKNGTYTLNFDLANVDLTYLHLIDNLTGADVDLIGIVASTGSVSYSFDAKMTDYASRFKLVFAEKQQSEETDDSDFVYFADGQMFAFSTEENSVIQIIDAAGRIVLNENVNGFVNKSLSLKSGVYVARMICGGAVKTQKFVAE